MYVPLVVYFHFAHIKRDKMLDHMFYLGPSPYEEDCIAVGENDYARRARLECQIYISQLKRMFKNIPQGVRFLILANDHDFGIYYEVVIQYNPNDATSIDFSLNVEENLPATWDELAKEERSKVA